MSVASVRSLTVRYGPKTAIGDLTLDFPEGCVGLLGPNGAGKSTLLKTMLGFLQPSAGSGTVLGLDIGAQGLEIRRRVGLMPEQDCHIPGDTAVAFVAYAGELAGMPRRRAMSRAHEVLEYCGLGEARYRNVETYSTGMKQRIKLAQAIVHGPSLLLLDEPTNGLDPAGRTEMLSLIADVSHGKGVSVIVSSHLLHDVEQTCDRVVVMARGRAVREGLVSDLRELQGRQIEVELQAPSPLFGEKAPAYGLELVREVGERYRLRAPDASTDPARAVFLAAREAGAQVRSLQPAQRSLQDVFLEAVE